MNKTSIKIIKRKDAQMIINAKIQSARKVKQAASFSEEKARRRGHREIVATVSNWISERREKNCIENNALFRQIFGDKLC